MDTKTKTDNPKNKKAKPKHHTRFWLAAACFVLCATLLIALADAVLCPKSDTMAAFYAEPKNTIDVLFVGGSHGAAAFDPIQLWEEQGLASYNLFSWGQPAWTSYHYIKEVLKTQRPRVVVVEAFGFMYENSYLAEDNFNETSDDYSLLMRPSLNRLQLAAAMSRWQTNRRPVQSYASLPRYHMRWQAFGAGYLSFFFEDHYSTAKGFGPNYTTVAFPQNTLPETPPEAGALYPGCEEYLYKMVELSKKEGFELVVATAPYVVEAESEWAVYRRIADICAENGVAYLDYNQAQGAEIGFDFATDMAEHAHVNLFGAQKISAHIGAWLAQYFPTLPDRRSQADYAYWHEAARVEGLDRERMALLMTADPADYLGRLASPNFDAFILTRGTLAGAAGGQVAAAGFTALGLPTTVFSGDAPAMLAVLEGGTPVQVESGAGPLSASTTTVNGTRVELFTDGETASILVDGEERARSGDGVLVLVLDRNTGNTVHNALLASDGHFAPTTE